MAQPEYSSTAVDSCGASNTVRLLPERAARELTAHARQLYGDLLAVIERDPEQEILGVALPVVDWVISSARAHIASSRPAGVGAAVVDLISPNTCDGGVPVRALDAWVVVGQLLAALAFEEAK